MGVRQREPAEEVNAMRCRVRPLLVPVVVLFAAPWVSASDLPVDGRMLLIKNTPSSNFVIYKAHDSLVGGQGTGTDGDPTCAGVGGGGGAFRLSGGGNDVTIPLPCANWRMIGGTNANPDYKYQDTTGDTCRTILVRHGRMLKVTCKGPQVSYVLGQAQGDVDVTLRLGTGPDRNCSTFGPLPTRVLADGSDGRRYLAKDAPAPAACTSP
jgi:hypothetical protein